MNPEGIVLAPIYDDFSFCIVNLANESSINSRSFNHPSFHGPTRLYGSCHGLLLVKHEYQMLMYSWNLFNPITLENLKIPVSSCDHYLSLGYDSLHDDYKIFSISWEEPGRMHVYSVVMGAWRSFGTSPSLAIRFCGSPGGLFLNGSIHWPASAIDRGESGDFVVAAFSLAQEEFSELPLPKGCKESNVRDYDKSDRLIVIGGCLAMMQCISSRGVIVFWVMQEYGVRDSWTKSAITTEKRINRYIGVLEEDEIVFVDSSLELVSYNWRNGVWRDFVDVGKPRIAYVVAETTSFGESLISPKL